MGRRVTSDSLVQSEPSKVTMVLYLSTECLYASGNALVFLLAAYHSLQSKIVHEGASVTFGIPRGFQTNSTLLRSKPDPLHPRSPGTQWGGGSSDSE
ncbi:hypothetical protein AVEN_77300-1 [Araneus ventricosus]|uniref:Uncharacterized protein n=1 Tax=Araneus ventricosus TaxID=182803 RepID=A0A4Y2R3B9_ARAVE|nr:hypothetical protein AVEN_77300-1 [Araneus ventricosus]